MKAHILPRRTAGSVAMMLAAMVCASTGFAAQEASTLRVQSDKAQPRFYLTPSIHQGVMNELTSEEREDARIQNNRSRSTEEKEQAPSSMLWPAYKFLPQISHSSTA